MTLGKDTFGLTKQDYNKKLSRIISNHRAASRLIGEPAEFILRSCRLSDQWRKMATDPEVKVYLRNIELAGGRKVKMISLERNQTRQPVPKAKLVDYLYPPRQTKTKATPEEAHYNKVKSAMRRAIEHQLKNFRETIIFPTVCPLTGMKIKKGVKCDVDHSDLSFSEIADRFIAAKNLTYTDIVLTGPPTAKIFKQYDLWLEWQEYHRQLATYELVHSSANRSKGSDGYTTPDELYGSFKAVSPEDLSLDF